ncbi:ABC transporter ATP-binding protein [Fodinicurvata sediminis]|uniref:ABC transporter ATP-binding protein n=1 Tax=Fodinicurvata sediminis TaxID=1121832 RepID=UPI0003B30952|nr:ABC transporter ATP-binding protein [Fodinicurvata sediminis]
MADPPIDLSVESISTFYGLSQILFDVSFTLGRGEVLALVGRNGVGKSTTMRSIAGLTPPKKGRIKWRGQDITGLASHRVCRSGIGFVPEDRRVFPELTVWENLDVVWRPENSEWTEERIFDIFPDLAELRHRNGGHLSGGQQQMLTIARTLMTSPKLLLLDEPSEGLAPLAIERMVNRIAVLKAEGLSIVLAEQNTEMVLALCERMHVMEKGVIRATLTPEEVQADESRLTHFLML